MEQHNLMRSPPELDRHVVVAGHICLDIIPDLGQVEPGRFMDFFQPGRMVQVGPVTFTTGGAVPNTGLALHRLGVPTRLCAKLGDDPLGQIVQRLIREIDPQLLSGIVVDPHSATSYTVVINPPGVDRIFLHAAAANDAFGSEDIPQALLAEADLFHFGYPPAIRCMYIDQGAALVDLYRRARRAGATTSCDTTFPDPNSESGCADWPAIFRAALPEVDVFLPSIEEWLFMTHRDEYLRLQAAAGDCSILSQVTPELLHRVSTELLEMGAKIVCLKLGHRGLYLRTADLTHLQRLGRAAPPDPSAWADRELWAPCFRAREVVGTTGAGDTTIAGFLAALLRGLDPEAALTTAVAVGACNVEAADALGGVCSWEATQARIAGGWARHALELDAPGWRWDPRRQVWSAGR